MTTRREAIRWLAGLPALGAIDWTSAKVERAARQLHALAEMRAPYAPTFFNAHEWRTVHLLSDYVIPRDERSGSATDAQVPEFMDFMLVDPDTSEPARVAMRGGLAWMDAECKDRFGATFADCSDTQRRQLLDLIAWPAKAPPELSAGVAFFDRFRDFTASGFFSSEMGWKDLRYMGNTALPSWEGCPPAALEKLGVSYSVMDRKPAK